MILIRMRLQAEALRLFAAAGPFLCLGALFAGKGFGPEAIRLACGEPDPPEKPESRILFG